MKITDAWVDDPSLDGVWEAPILSLEVDETPEPADPEPFHGGWTSSKSGPFVKYTGPGSADYYNMRFRGQFPVIIDVNVYVGDSEKALEGNYALAVSRALQAAKKIGNWSLRVDERSAEMGYIYWRPVMDNPRCRARNNAGEVCNLHPAKMRRINNVDIPFCQSHHKEMNNTSALRRQSA